MPRTTADAATRVRPPLERLGLKGIGKVSDPSHALAIRSPIDGSSIGQLETSSADTARRAAEAASAAFTTWRMVPAPIRGEFVRRLGEAFRRHKADLAELITFEAGKITQESLGEVQEMIDICDFAVGLSRQLHGLTIASERPGHRLMEQWHPLGPVLVITAFNFPMAVWAWNAALAFVCGNPVVWKPSEKTPLCALGVQAVVERVLDDMGHVPRAVSQVLIGGRELSESLVEMPAYALVSAT